VVESNGPIFWETE